jgi:hypothetical protein
MAAAKRCSHSISILPSLVGEVIGIFILISVKILIEMVTYYIRQHGPDIKGGIEHESHMPDTPLCPLDKCSYGLAITTAETMPGHALSDMDRDIQLQSANRQDLGDLEAVITRRHW